MTDMTQEELKKRVGQAALAYVPSGEIIGVGTGSTVNCFIDALGIALAEGRLELAGAVSSSEATTARLQAIGVRVLDANAVERLSLYIDGADEIDPSGCMIKGGGGALTREKIVAALAQRFVCIADASKQVAVLGRFPLPVEVIPMAASLICREMALLGGVAVLRQRGGSPVVTDNGNHIVDVSGLQIREPLVFEREVQALPGVVTVGVFAEQGADVALIGASEGVVTQLFKRS
jgi:ribose 5-phosphate isomerase A